MLGIVCQMFPLTSETILLRELWEELLHSLSTHQTWAQSQWGEAAQVSHYVPFFSSPGNSNINLGCFSSCISAVNLLSSSGVWLMDALRPLSQIPAWRTTWLGFTRSRRSNIKYNNSEISLFSFYFVVLVSSLRRIVMYWLAFSLIFFQCDHQGCGKNFIKRNQLKAHKCEHQELLPFQ